MRQVAMGRPREFEIEDALDASADAFWTGGFEGTSLDDLMAATGLHKGSLYKAFDGKHDLFKQSLQHYLSKIAAYHRESFAQRSSPKAAIRHWFVRSAEFCRGDDGTFRGCLAMNTISEMGADDPDFTGLLMGYYQRMMAVIAQIVACRPGAREDGGGAVRANGWIQHRPEGRAAPRGVDGLRRSSARPDESMSFFD
jgi:TetR/AcrR family transcriptional repressor of nem operon